MGAFLAERFDPTTPRMSRTPPSAPPRIVLANLDGEHDFAASTGRPRTTLSRPARQVAADLGTLLRTFCRADDHLWLLAPVADDRWCEVPWLPRPSVVRTPHRSSAVLAWAETTTVEHHRVTGTPGPVRALAEEPLHELLWRMPPAAPEVAARVNDRAFSSKLATSLGVGLPGARRVVRAEDLDEGSLVTRPWALKAAHAAAGRWRVIHRPPAAWPTDRIARLLARHGPSYFEPWLERTLDVGALGLVDDRGWRDVGVHRLRVDQDGHFTGIDIVADGASILGHRDHRALGKTMGAVADALRSAGYSGPFGVDAWAFRRADGRAGFHPLGEINARLTFGFVARSLAERWGVASLTLRTGRMPSTAPAAGWERVELLRPEVAGGRSLWVEGRTRAIPDPARPARRRPGAR